MYQKNRSPHTPGYNQSSAAVQQSRMPGFQPATPLYQQMPQDHPQQSPAANTQYGYTAAPPVQAPAPPAPMPNHTAANNAQAPAPQSAQGDYISGKITKINAANKVMDFSDALVKAFDKDYANLHGTGGAEHAPNSGIRLSLCDYTNSNASVNVRFILDVRQCDRLLSIAEAAINGTLGVASQLRAVKDYATANGMLVGWLQAGHQPTYQELAGLQQIIYNGLMAQDPEGKGEPAWTYSVQKNNPYNCTYIDGKEYTPVSALSLAYTPSRNYAWSVKVSNYMAPINRQDNGTTSHNSKGAIDKKEVVIPVTAETFYCALCDVSHYIHLWEYRMYPIVNAMSNERERRAAIKRQQSKNK